MAPNMTFVHPETIRPAPWRATYILKPDLKLLERSIFHMTMLFPILVQKETSYIIDGFARWVAAQNLGETYGLQVPVLILDLDDTDSMILHVEMNRGRGSVVAKDLSNLIQRCIRSEKYDYDSIRERMNMTADEFDILADGSLVKRKKMREHKYSKAWVPVETSGLGEKPSIERPKTPDK